MGYWLARVALTLRRKHRLGGVSGRRRKHWGWGFEDQQASPGDLRASVVGLAAHLGMTLGDIEEPVALEAAT